MWKGSDEGRLSSGSEPIDGTAYHFLSFIRGTHIVWFVPLAHHACLESSKCGGLFMPCYPSCHLSPIGTTFIYQRYAHARREHETQSEGGTRAGLGIGAWG